MRRNSCKQFNPLRLTGRVEASLLRKRQKEFLDLPHPLVHPSKLHGIRLLISPMISGLVLGGIGRTVRQRGRTPVQIESFCWGFTFAFAVALTRLLMVR